MGGIYTSIIMISAGNGGKMEFSRNDLEEAKRRVKAFEIANWFIENELGK